jgi:hypothetical protein
MKKKKLKFNSNYLGHNFVGLNLEDLNAFPHDYICLNCNIRIVYHEDIKDEQYRVADYCGLYDKCLTCDEMVIKNIIE